MASGVWGTVEYALDGNGQMPAKEFLESLDQDDDAPNLAKLLQWFQWMAENGQIANDQKFKHEKGDIYAFKAKTNEKKMVRIPCFRIRNRWILTHGFYKPGRSKWRPQEFTTAERIQLEHMEWEQPPPAKAPKKKPAKRRKRK